ncbi:MAG: TadE family protein [Planctomycetota bacterium]
MNTPCFTRAPRDRRRQESKGRGGLAVAELAVGLPILLLVTMGTIEACAMIRVKQKLNTIAYEGARVGILPEAGADNVQFQCDTLAADYGLNNVGITMTPGDPGSLDSGEWFTVDVNVDYADNSLVGTWMMPAVAITETVALQRP